MPYKKIDNHIKSIITENSILDNFWIIRHYATKIKNDITIISLNVK